MVLRACYFCGSPGEVLDTYPVVPDRVASDREDSERVVLCPDCHAKLERVLDDVLGAVDATAGAGASTAATSASDETGISGAITFDDADGGDDSAADREGVGSASDAAETQDDAAETQDDAAETRDDPTGTSEDSATEPADAAGETDDDGGAEPRDGEPPADTEREGEPRGDDADDAEAEQSDDGDGSSGSLRGLGNSGTNEYRKALRLLQNREFPMPRSDLVDVMSSAYDLTREECDRLVEVAVDRDWVVDDGGVLRRE